MLVSRVFFFFFWSPNNVNYMPKPTKKILVFKRNCILDPCSKSKNFMPNSHPYHTKEIKLANINLIPPFFALIQKKRGWGEKVEKTIAVV